MANPERWQSYVNDVVFADVGGVSMNPPYKIATGTHTSEDFLKALKDAGWWWPALRPNLNKEHSGGTNLQREVESNKWIHITILPGQTEVTTRFLGIKTAKKWLMIGASLPEMFSYTAKDTGFSQVPSIISRIFYERNCEAWLGRRLLS